MALVPVQEAGEAFLASLSTRRLDLRSALGSWAVARYLPEHAFTSADRVFCDTSRLSRLRATSRHLPAAVGPLERRSVIPISP